ncbi:MAG: Cell division protein FtsL [Chloroflexi bacterium OLB14]|nr:MAG: Cell division protein FtsL [Chloroflexi bacterium OLB14]
MNIPNVNFIHAYRVAPWRVQRQWIGNALLFVVVLAMVAGLYLNVTSRTAIAGREIQDLMNSIAESQQVSSDLHTQLALLTSSASLEFRASKLGFRPVEATDLQYLLVPGYVAPTVVDLSSSTAPQLSALTIPPEYNQSLLDWFDEAISTSRRARQQ